MKKPLYALTSSIYCLVFLLLASSCGDLGNSPFDFSEEEEQPFVDPGSQQIFTLIPEVSSSRAVFKGEIRSIENIGEVKYGFMWYALEGTENLDPIKVEVGSTSTAQSFSTEMLELPVETQLVVCAYIENSGFEETMMIGDEQDFTVPR